MTSARRAPGAAALGIVLLASACGGAGADGVSSEPAPSEQVVCFGGGYGPAVDGETVPREEACPDESPSASQAGGSRSATASAAPGWDPAAAFLAPEAASRAEMPGWRVRAEYEPEAGPLLDPCGEGVFPRADDVAASAERALGSQREVGGSGLAQEVFRYSSPEAASDALDAYAEAVERCPERPAPQSPEGHTDRFSVVEQTDDDGVRRLLVRRQPCAGPDRCTAHFRTYLFAAQAGDGVTVADYGIGEDGDPEAEARALLDAAAAQLAAVVERR